MQRPQITPYRHLLVRVIVLAILALLALVFAARVEGLW
jgi:hypothetical protein